jgi:hypothetical protein
MFIYVIIVIFVIYLIYQIFGHIEPYINLNIYPSRLLFMRRYAKLNKIGRITSLDVNPIQPGINESQCLLSLCPKYYSDNITCYYCI